MSTKEQFKMYLEPDLIERLTQVAAKFNRDSKQDVVEEIVSVYLPTWIAVNESMRRAIAFQTKLITSESERQVNAITVPRIAKIQRNSTTTSVPSLTNRKQISRKRREK